MNNQIFTLENLLAQIALANVAWVERNGEAPSAISDDLTRARKSVDANVCAYVAGIIEPDQQQALLGAVGQRMGTKAIMRMCEMFAMLSQGKGATIPLLLSVNGGLIGNNGEPISRSAVWFAMSKKGDEHTSDQIKQLDNVRKLQKVFGLVGVSTVATKLSQTFGDNGFGRVLGMGAYDKQKKGEESKLTINPENVFVKAIRDYTSKATEATLALNAGGKKKSK